MPRGKKGKNSIRSLANTVDEKDIVDLGEEQNPPNILIEKNFGITGKYGDYALVQKSIAHRTGNDDDGVNKGKVIRYYKWTDVSYHPNIFACVKAYSKLVNLNSIKKLDRVKEFSVVEDILRNTQNTIDTFLHTYVDFNEDTKQTISLIDKIVELQDKVNDINKVLKQADELRELIKDKRKIIVNETEPKKHRIKLEKD